MGQGMTLKASASIIFNGEEIDVPLEPSRNEFGKAILIPDFSEVMYRIRSLKARGIIKKEVN